jgi:hypothetical protein
MTDPLCGMLDGTTSSAHVFNTCAHAEERSNKTPIIITGVNDNRAFLALLQASCLCDVTAQLKAKELTVVPLTAHGFRAMVSALQTLDVRECVPFYTFLPPVDRCVRLQ